MVGLSVSCIGNYADPYYLWNGADLQEMIDRVDHPLFTACWDADHSNHFFPEHCNQYNSILDFGNRCFGSSAQFAFLQDPAG